MKERKEGCEEEIKTEQRKEVKRRKHLQDQKQQSVLALLQYSLRAFSFN